MAPTPGESSSAALLRLGSVSSLNGQTNLRHKVEFLHQQGDAMHQISRRRVCTRQMMAPSVEGRVLLSATNAISLGIGLGTAQMEKILAALTIQQVRRVAAAVVVEAVAVVVEAVVARAALRSLILWTISVEATALQLTEALENLEVATNSEGFMEQ